MEAESQLRNWLLFKSDSERETMTLPGLRNEAKNAQLVHNSRQRIRKCLKQELGLRFRKKKQVYSTNNTNDNLVARQKFAQKFLEVLEQGYVIVNVDESSVDRLDFKAKCWQY